MMKRIPKKIVPIKIIETFWNDSETRKYIGMTGAIISDKKSYFIDVKLYNIKSIMTFHVSELELI